MLPELRNDRLDMRERGAWFFAACPLPLRRTPLPGSRHLRRPTRVRHAPRLLLTGDHPMARIRPPADRTFRQKEPDSRLLTSERIANDLSNFQKSGGRIEVLGVTQVLKKLGEAGSAPDAPTPTPVRPGAGRRSSR